MDEYRYKAILENGKVVEQSIQARSRSDVITLLKSKNMKLVSIKKQAKQISIFGGKVSTVDRANFCRHMSIMLRSGLSISEAVELILSEAENPKLKQILQDLSFSLQEGGEISVIFQRYPEVFDKIFLALVRSGEQSGTLEKTFQYLADQSYSSHRLSKKVQGAFMYPAVIMTVMAGMGIVMMTFVLPKLSEVFLKMNIKLPMTTKILLSVGTFMGDNVIVVFGTIIGLIVLIAILLRNPKNKEKLKSVLANAPLIKKLYKQIDLARFSKTLSSLLEAGVPIIKSLNIASETLTQKNMIKVASEFEKGITEGKQIGDLFDVNKNAFPSIMVQTIRTGEKTGTLDKVLKDISSYYEEELDEALKTFSTMLEPIIMIIIGLAVGAMVISVLTPIYGLVGGMGI